MFHLKALDEYSEACKTRLPMSVMIEYEIVPHVGVEPIRFGMTREEVHAEFGLPEFTSRDNREEFMNGFMVDFNAGGAVEFIELAKSYQFRALFNNRCLHELLADEAVAFVRQYDHYKEDDPELGYSYLFLDLQLSLWRPTVPETAQPLDDPDGRYFYAVGLAKDGYFT